MAKLIINDKELFVDDNSAIIHACEDAGVPFSCQAGVCGTCQIEIVEGAGNLAELNQEEEDMGMDTFNRLACQCRIKSGDVRIQY